MTNDMEASWVYHGRIKGVSWEHRESIMGASWEHHWSINMNENMNYIYDLHGEFHGILEG